MICQEWNDNRIKLKPGKRVHEKDLWPNTNKKEFMRLSILLSQGRVDFVTADPKSDVLVYGRSVRVYACVDFFTSAISFHKKLCIWTVCRNTVCNLA